jgi:hypothetical protein
MRIGYFFLEIVSTCAFAVVSTIFFVVSTIALVESTFVVVVVVPFEQDAKSIAVAKIVIIAFIIIIVVQFKKFKIMSKNSLKMR